MLTESEWKTLKLALKLLCKTHLAPFDWDVSKSILIPTKSKVKVVFSFVSLSAASSYCLFDIVRLPATYDGSEANAADVVMHSLCCMWFGTVAGWQYIINFKNRREFALLLNQQICFNFTKRKWISGAGGKVIFLLSRLQIMCDLSVHSCRLWIRARWFRTRTQVVSYISLDCTF